MSLDLSEFSIFPFFAHELLTIIESFYCSIPQTAKAPMGKFSREGSLCC
jgi:hypothetical protein